VTEADFQRAEQQIQRANRIAQREIARLATWRADATILWCPCVCGQEHLFIRKNHDELPQPFAYEKGIPGHSPLCDAPRCAEIPNPRGGITVPAPARVLSRRTGGWLERYFAARPRVWDALLWPVSLALLPFLLLSRLLEMPRTRRYQAPRKGETGAPKPPGAPYLM
jgi:hypothetical protein